MVKFFYRFLYWMVPWWYGFTMQMTRKRKYPEVETYFTKGSIPGAISWGRRWRKDPGRKGFLDVLSSPRKVQYKINQGDVGIGDCDDHAIYWATALLKSDLAQRAFLGTLWMVKPGKEKGGAGHVVCVFQDKLGDWYWTDYHDPKQFSSGFSWANDCAARYGRVVTAAGLVEVKLRKSGEPKLRKKVKRYIP